MAVQFADGYASRTVRYLLHKGPTGWRVQDIVYADGSTFTQSLRVKVPERPTTRALAPQWAVLAREKESATRGLVQDRGTVTPIMLMADFDGDGRLDVAWLVRKRSTGQRGVLLVHASSRVPQLFGAGVRFGNGGDNFDWMDSWKVLPRRTGTGSALLVERTESAGGRIEFRSGRYQWIQVGD